MSRRTFLTREMLWAVTGLCGLGLSAAASDQQTLEAMQQRFAAMRSVRDALVQRLQQRIAADAKKGENADYFLRLQEGADEEDMHVVLRRRGGRWLAAYSAVPFWRQESFQDKFRYLHRGGNGYVKRDKWRFPVEAGALAAQGRQLRGTAVIDVGIDHTREERFPPGTPVRWANTGEVFTWFELMNAVSHNTVRRQRYAIQADTSQTVREFALVLDNAVAGRCPLEVVFRVPSSPWVSPEVRATWWNCGRHAADASGVVVKDGRLSGALKVTFKPDQWYPKKPLEVTYVLAGGIDGPRCSGTYKAAGGFGELAGSFEGECGQFVTGRFEAEGDLGRYSSQIHGRKLPVRSTMAPLLSAGANTPKTPAEAVASMNETYHQIRALDMALKQYPLPIEAAVQQTAGTGCRWGKDGQPTQSDHADMLAHADEALRWVRAALEQPDRSPYVHGLSGPADTTFGPFYNSTPLKADGESACSLPAVEPSGPQQWSYVPAWQVLGPLSHLDDYDRDFSEIPEVLPSKARYPVDKANFPRKLAPKGEAIAEWKVVTTDGPKLASPWQDIRRRGTFRGHSLFAAATLNAPKAMDVWVAMAALEHGKLWVNERLVWVSDERPWRNHSGREAVFKVGIRQGANRILVRCREDRGEAWFRMHVCLRGGPAAEPPKPAVADAGPVRSGLGDGAGHFPDADPPLAWDLDEGQNVAWSAKLPEPVDAGPAAVGGRLFYCTQLVGMACVDQKTGNLVWHRKDMALDPIEGEERKALEEKLDAVRASWKEEDRRKRVALGSRWEGVFSDGKLVWAHHGLGTAVCLDAAGKKKWAVKTGLTRPAMLVTNGMVILEAAGATGKNREDAPGRRLGLDAATGKVLWQKDLPTPGAGGDLHQLRLTGHDSAKYMVASTSGQVFDARDGRAVLDGLDIDADPPGARPRGIFAGSEGFAWHFSDNDLYCAKLSTIYAVRFFMDPHGQVGHRVLWRNNYGIKYDGSIPMCAWGPWAMAVNTVQENCPGHSNAWRREVNVYDRQTGKPVVRLKPVLDQSQSWGPSPSTSPGRYLFVYDLGALTDAGQIAVIDLAVDQPHVICVNHIPKGAAAPTFDGQRMFLHRGAEIWCVSAATPEGKRYQQRQIAAELVHDIMAVPTRKVKLDAPEPLKELPAFSEAPCDRLEDRQGAEHWLLAAPLPPPKADQDAALADKLASLRPTAGTKLAIGGVTKAFEALGRGAVDLDYSWGHAYYLDGLGGVTAHPYRKIDMLRCTGGDPQQCGLLYTLVDNSRDREVTVDVPRRGLDVWLGGLKVRTGQKLHLRQGVYPLLVRVRPECFERPLPPLDVRAALAKETALPLDWPKRWMVAGSVPGSVDLVPPDQLRRIPDKLVVAGQTYALAARNADDQGWLDLKDMGVERDGKLVTKQTAYCFAPIECDRNATLVVNCSADWWMLWYLDGKLVYSTMAGGNGTNPKKLNAHTWSAALSKGRHVLAAVVRSGSQGWSMMSLGAMIDKPIEELRKEQIDPKAPVPPTKVTPVSFSLQDTPAAILAARLRSARVRRKALEKVVADVPDTPEGAAAAKWLKLLRQAEQD